MPGRGGPQREHSGFVLVVVESAPVITASRFIGREAEVHAIRRALAAERIVTVTGPGGCGKSRMAHEALGTDRPVIVADLATVEAEPAIAVLRALRADTAPWESTLDACIRHLGDRSMVVVLDGCEHLVAEAARFVTSIVSSTSGTAILATSREPLRVPGERVLRVGPLPIEDAVALFLDRADRAGASACDAHEVRMLCALLDGLPLAIEIAAARTAAISPADLLDSWRRWPQLLRGRRGVHRRHVSVADCIDWSVRLLSDEERRVLFGLSVFHGWFELEAVRAVCGEAAVAAAASISEKSLLQVAGQDGRTRYRMFDLVRDVARSALAADPDEERRVRGAHLRRLCDVATALEPAFASSSVSLAICALRAELPELRAALDWAARSDMAEEAHELAGSLWRFWWAGARGEGADAITATLATSGVSPRARARALVAGVLSASGQLEFALAAARGAAAVEQAELDGDVRLIAWACCWHGWLLASQGDPEADRRLARAEDLARSVGDDAVLADTLNARAYLAVRRGDPRTAMAALEESTPIIDSAGHRIARCHALASRATAQIMLGDLVAAEAVAGEAHALATDLADDV